MTDWREKLEAMKAALLSAASPDVLAICRAWHGESFGLPGHGGAAWVCGEIDRAQKAADALCRLRESQEKKP